MLGHIRYLRYNLVRNQNSSFHIFRNLDICYIVFLSAMWMTLEAVVLFIMTTNSALAYHSANQNKLKMILVSIGWGIPALFVTSSAGSGFSSGFYMAKVRSDFSQIKNLKVYTQCWIDADVVFYAVGLPLACSMMINLVVSIRVTRFVQQVRLAKRFLKQHKGLRLQVENMKTAAKCNILLLPVFGIPWMFMYFSGKCCALNIFFFIMHFLLCKLLFKKKGIQKEKCV